MTKKENIWLIVCGEAVEFKLVKLEIICTLILPLTISVLWVVSTYASVQKQTVKNFGSNFCTTNFLGVFKSGTEKRLMVFTQKISQDIGSLLYLEKPIMLQNRVTCPSQLFTFFVKKRNPNPISSFVCRNLKKVCAQAYLCSIGFPDWRERVKIKKVKFLFARFPAPMFEIDERFGISKGRSKIRSLLSSVPSFKRTPKFAHN